jgi:hypothetical protein
MDDWAFSSALNNFFLQCSVKKRRKLEMMREGRDAMCRVSTEGLKARQSLAQGSALCHGRHLSTPEALKGRNPDKSIPPFQGWAFAGIHSAGRCPALLIIGLSALTRCVASVTSCLFRIA